MKGNPDSEFINECRKIDFSDESVNRERNLENIKRLLKDTELGASIAEGENIVKRKTRKTFTTVAVIAAVLSLTLAGVYAEDLYRIIKAITLGEHATYFVTEDEREFIPLPEELNVKLYDEAGNKTNVWRKGEQLFNAEGEPVIIDFSGGEFIAVTVSEYKAERENEKNDCLKFYDLAEGAEHFICDVLMPSYLPEGYSFNRIEYFPDTLEKLLASDDSRKYMNVYYSNGINEMYEQIRFMDKSTAFESSTSDDINEITIKGNDAVISGKNLDIQIGDVMYMFFGNEDINSNELIKIAESLTEIE